MNILIVSQYFWPENFRINDLAVGLKQKGHSVTVLTGIPNYPQGSFFNGYGLLKKNYEEYQEIKILRVPLIPRGKGKGWELALNYLSFTVSASLLAPFLCQEKYDCIFVSQYSPVTVGIPAIILKKLKGIPIVLWIQDLWPESLSATGAVQSKSMLALVGKVVKFIYKNSDLILVQCKGFTSQVVNNGISENTIRFLPNWAEDLYKPVKLKANAPERDLIPDGFCVMFAGNIGAAQDFGTILKAVDRLKAYKDIHWVILGDGRMYDWLKEQIVFRELTSSVHLLGRHPIEKMPNFFSLADVMLVTLKDEPIFALTIPGKIQSYMACAKPIIACINGEGAKLIEESGAGLACCAEDAEGLARNITIMYEKAANERVEMGLKGRSYYEQNFMRKDLIDNLAVWMSEL